MVQRETIYNEVDNSWNYACNISCIKNFKLKFNEKSKDHELLIIYNNGSDVTITHVNPNYYLNFLSCISRYKNQKNECDFLIMTQQNVYLLTDIYYKE